MLQSTENKAQERLNTSINGNTQNKENYLILQEPIEGTPFYITGNESTGYFLRMGHYRLTEYIPDNIIDSQEPTASKEEIINYFLEYLETEKWQIIITMIAAAAHMNKELNVQLEQEKFPQ